MIAIKNQPEVQEFVVVHPMFDVAEKKHDGAELGCVKMKRSLKISLILLRVYIIAVGLLLAYHELEAAHLFGRGLLGS